MQVTVIHQIWRRKRGLFHRGWPTQLRSLWCHTSRRGGSCSSRRRVQSAWRAAHWPESAAPRRSSTNILSSEFVHSRQSSTSIWPVTEHVMACATNFAQFPIFREFEIRILFVNFKNCKKSWILTIFKTANEFYCFLLCTFFKNVCANKCSEKNFLQVATTRQFSHQFICNVNSKVRVNSSYSML